MKEEAPRSSKRDMNLIIVFCIILFKIALMSDIDITIAMGVGAPIQTAGIHHLLFDYTLLRLVYQVVTLTPLAILD